MKLNGISIEPLHEDRRDILCIKDSMGNFTKGEIYQYIKHQHGETGVEVWVIYNKIGEAYFYTSRLCDIFDCRSVIRDDKINKILE